MKIKITTDRLPWVNDKPQPMGEVVEADAATAKTLIDLGYAEAVKK